MLFDMKFSGGMVGYGPDDTSRANGICDFL